MSVNKRRPKTKNVYFTQETEDAIIAYNNSTSHIEKSKIYEEKIHYAFFKLTQNIIHTFKFYHTDIEELEDLQHEIITFLLTKIHKFDQTKGFKAYSYFGTIVKRWLILYNKKNYSKKITTQPISTLEDDEGYSYDIDETKIRPEKEKIIIFTDAFVVYVDSNLFELFPKEQESKIADQIIELFRKRDYISIFNKKALYINIKEKIDVKTPKITKIAEKLYEIYKENYTSYLDNGYIEFPPPNIYNKLTKHG